MPTPAISAVEDLPDAARYAPWERGRYDVRAGLAALGTDCGNGAHDAQAFQVDAAFAAFRRNKLVARAERLAKYWQRTPAFAEIAGAVCAVLARRLAAEHPQHFRLTEGPHPRADAAAAPDATGGPDSPCAQGSSGGPDTPCAPRAPDATGTDGGPDRRPAHDGARAPDGHSVGPPAGSRAPAPPLAPGPARPQPASALRSPQTWRLRCLLTGETLTFDARWGLAAVLPTPPGEDTPAAGAPGGQTQWGPAVALPAPQGEGTPADAPGDEAQWGLAQSQVPPPGAPGRPVPAPRREPGASDRLDLGAPDRPGPPYADAFDALACQVAEDLAVIRRCPDGTDEVCAIHLCAANHWGAEAKVGGSFAATHAPVPGMEPVNRRAASLVDAMVDRGPFVRFVWGLATDTRLNHHPEPPPGVRPEAWHGRRFDPARPRLWVRVERQVTLGVPEAGAALFLIRTSFRDGDAVRADATLNAALQAALGSMTPEQAAYKGVGDSRAAILAWLAEGAPAPQVAPTSAAARPAGAPGAPATSGAPGARRVPAPGTSGAPGASRVASAPALGAPAPGVPGAPGVPASGTSDAPSVPASGAPPPGSGAP